MKTDYFAGTDEQGFIIPGTMAHTLAACRAKSQPNQRAVAVTHFHIDLDRVHADAEAWANTKNVFRWEGMTA